MTQNHYAAGALSQGHAHNVVLLAYLRSKETPVSIEAQDPTPTETGPKLSLGPQPIGFARGLPIYRFY
jgi:hypothetical protein